LAFNRYLSEGNSAEKGSSTVRLEAVREETQFFEYCALESKSLGSPRARILSQDRETATTQEDEYINHFASFDNPLSFDDDEGERSYSPEFFGIELPKPTNLAFSAQF
jgi:hypothetical protein